MTAELCEAVAKHVRYYTPDENEETRAQRNIRFGRSIPEIIIPPRGLHVWEWFFDAVELKSDHCEITTSKDWLAWQEITGAIIHAREWRILRDMDKAYVIEMRKERRDLQVRLSEKNDNGRHR